MHIHVAVNRVFVEEMNFCGSMIDVTVIPNESDVLYAFNTPSFFKVTDMINKITAFS